MNDDVWNEAPPAARDYRAALPSGELLVFPITALDRTGIPTWKAVFFADDDDARSVHHGHSYGPTDGAALLGALGELSESVHAHAALATLPHRRASYAALATSEGAANVVHPWRLCPPAGSAVDGDTELLWIRGARYSSESVVWLPLDVVAIAPDDAPGYEPFATPITNGLGAGPTRDFALAHGVQELLQRDGNGLVFRALDAGIALDLRGVTDPVVRMLLGKFARAGIEPIVKFASDEFGIANVYAVGAERSGARAPFPLAITAAGEAASPTRDVALRKALLEFGAARPRKTFAHAPLEFIERVAPSEYFTRIRERPVAAGAERRALDAMLAWLDLDQDALRAIVADPILRVRETRDVATLPNWHPEHPELPPGEELMATLAERLDAARLEVCYVDFTTPESAARGVHVVRAIVPRLEVETMSYHRIGERNARKLLASGSPLVARTGGPGRARVRLLPDAEERLGGQVWLSVAVLDRIVGPFYALYREPDVHAAPRSLESAAP